MSHHSILTNIIGHTLRQSRYIIGLRQFNRPIAPCCVRVVIRVRPLPISMRTVSRTARRRYPFYYFDTGADPTLPHRLLLGFRQRQHRTAERIDHFHVGVVAFISDLLTRSGIGPEISVQSLELLGCEDHVSRKRVESFEVVVDRHDGGHPRRSRPMRSSRPIHRRSPRPHGRIPLGRRPTGCGRTSGSDSHP